MRFLSLAFAFLLSLAFVQPAAAGTNCTGQNADVGVATLTAHASGTVNSPDQANCTGRGVIVVVDLTTMTTASVVVTVQGKDHYSGKYYTLLASAAKTSTGTFLLVVYPGTTVAANADADMPTPATWRVSVAISDSGGTAAVTGTVGASVLN